jgi:hypothetical protein
MRAKAPGQGCQIFLGKIYQNGKIHMYTKRPQNTLNVHNKHQTSSKYAECRWIMYIYHNFPFQGLPKCSKSVIFGKKINHLATLLLGILWQRACLWPRFWKADKSAEIGDARSRDPARLYQKWDMRADQLKRFYLFMYVCMYDVLCT